MRRGARAPFIHLNYKTFTTVMNSIKKYLNSLGRGARFVVLSLAVVFVSAGIAQAATTISTNISTGGTLTMTDKTALAAIGQASTTMISVTSNAYFGGTATSTFSSAGALTLIAALTGTTGSFSSTLNVTGSTTLSSASTTWLSALTKASFGSTATSTFDSAGNLAVIGTLGVTGASTLAISTLSTTTMATTTMASTTITSFKVGHGGTQMTQVIEGTCTLVSNSSISATTTGTGTCATAGSLAGDKVFVTLATTTTKLAAQYALIGGGWAACPYPLRLL